MSDPLLQFNAKIFAAQLHTRFKVRSGDDNLLSLELAEVLEPTAAPQVELFILHFRGPRAPRLAQQIYRLEHEGLGAFDLFLSAIGADEQSTDYEAVFHRLRKNKS
jgi:hypothetical protein